MEWECVEGIPMSRNTLGSPEPGTAYDIVVISNRDPWQSYVAVVKNNELPPQLHIIYLPLNHDLEHEYIMVDVAELDTLIGVLEALSNECRKHGIATRRTE